MAEETEYKFLVEKDKFYEIMENIKNRYPNAYSCEKLQINYYYDTDDQYLLSNNTTLRIRQIGSELSLELKEAIPVIGSNYSTCTETNRNISSLRSDITLEEGNFAWIPFTMQGNLVTKRLSIQPSESLSIDFDVNYYLGKCDYEIELEFTANASKATAIFIEQLDLMQYRNNIGGKARRFFQLKSDIFKD